MESQPFIILNKSYHVKPPYNNDIWGYCPGSPVCWTHNNFIKLSQLFLIYIFALTTVADVSITKVIRYDEKPRDQR